MRGAPDSFDFFSQAGSRERALAAQPLMHAQPQLVLERIRGRGVGGERANANRRFFRQLAHENLEPLLVCKRLFQIGHDLLELKLDLNLHTYFSKRFMPSNLEVLNGIGGKLLVGYHKA